MPTALRLLILEDEPNDVELEIAVLEEAGYSCQWERVETREDFLARLEAQDYDLILSDYKLPSFDGLTALNLVLERKINIPFILVSGTLGEEVAIESLKLGATDYVLKSSLSRLAPVVQRALREHAEHRQRQRAEESLRESEERLRAIVETANDAIISIDSQGDIVAWNGGAQATFGYSVDEIIGQSVTLIMPERYREDHQSCLRRAASEGARRIIGTTVEFVGLRKDGSEFPLELSLAAWKSREEVFFTAIARDFTERKRAVEERDKLQKQFLQAQKMEAVGILAGGVAHDFNNLLTVINGYAGFAAKNLREGDPLKVDIQQILDAGQRAATLTRQLLAFSRKQVMKPRVLDLNEVVGDLEKMLKRLIGEDIEFSTLLAEGLGQVSADPGQIEQVLMNLAVNARDAMPKGGKLTIETTNVELDEEYVSKQPDMVAGSYVMLAVTDNGAGMTSEVKERIFEPFYTTKEKGQGTGLGLSTAYGIVNQSGGNIWVYSVPGQGTTFKVYLPRVEDEKTEQQTETETTDLQGTEAILIVEDDESVRNLTSRILAAVGYKVVTAANGGEALLECERRGSEINLVLTDVVMPKMSGKELIDRLTVLCPGLKALYMSGHTDNAIVHHGVLDEGSHFIAKPFNPPDLLKKVRMMLETGGRRSSDINVAGR